MKLRNHERGDASGLVTTYAVLLFGLPAQLVIGPLGASGTPAGVLGVGLVLYWVVMRLVPDSGTARGVQPIRLAVGFFAASILVSYAFGVVRPLPPDQLSGADRGVLSVLSWVGIAIVAADMLSTREKVEKLLRVILVLGGIVALMGLLQFAVGINLADFYKIPGLKVNYAVAVISERSDFRRVAATASHPIEFGMVLAMLLPLALHTAFYAKDRRALWWGIVGLIGLTSPMSLSRSAILGLAVAFIVLFFGWPAGRRMSVLLVLPVFVIGLRFLIPGLVGTIKSLFTSFSNDDSIKGRTDDYAVVGQFIDKSPLVGRGFGTFLPKDFITLDNQYLGTVIETGYLGLAALISLFLIGFFTARGIRVRSTDERTRDLAQSLAASVMVAAFGYVTFDGLGFPMVTGLLFLLLGCIGALWRITREELATTRSLAATSLAALLGPGPSGIDATDPHPPLANGALPVNGSAPNGSAPNGSAPKGSAPNGSAPQSGSNGSAPNGVVGAGAVATAAPTGVDEETVVLGRPPVDGPTETLPVPAEDPGVDGPTVVLRPPTGDER